ncbi:SYP22 [Symbiodinium microadriaticum]|nr:SYP22 [Symbiodinium microadriaticum]
MDDHVQNVNALPRDQAVGRRVSVVKLQKDYERVKLQYQTILSNYASMRVDRTSAAAARSSDGTLSTTYDSGSAGADQQFSGQKQQALMMQGQDVDDAIIEEREKDIKKINHDLVLVNEMFRDMAQIVEGQGKTIEKIAEDTESSRERAEQGLAEVKQAAIYQPTCSIS